MPEITPGSPSPVSAFLSALHAGPAQHAKSLSLWPLLPREDAGSGATAPPYVTLAEALDAGTLLVDEVCASGSVPHVLADNQGDVAVLVLFGEELRGAMQNRVANASFLVPARTRLDLDVSCVEQGRWRRRPGDVFAASREVLSSAIRSKMLAKVHASRRLGRRFDADQREVWESVSERLTRSGSDSATGAWADHARSRRAQLAELEGAFHLLPGQLGFAAAIGGEVVGLEAIGRPEVFARSFPALLRAYLIDAVDGAAARDATDTRAEARFDAPETFIEALSRAAVENSPSLGLGDDLRLSGQAVEGCALVAGEVVQVTAFPRGPKPPARGSRRDHEAPAA